MTRRNPLKPLGVCCAGLIAATLIGAISAPVHAQPPTHVMNIIKDGTATIPPLAQCPAGNSASIDLTFHDVFHLTFTDATFHLTETQTGTFITRDANGGALATGHFTTTLSDQGPGFPTEAFTNIINGTGKSSDGSLVHVHIAQHFTITPNGEVAVQFSRADCG